MQNAGYLRVSSDKQDIARQRASINKWAERAGRSIDVWFEDSQGRNSRDLAGKRQGFQKMLKAVEAGVVTCIIVDSQDRFGTRDAHEWGKFLTILRDHDCSLLDASGKELSADDDASVLMGTIGALTSTREQKEKAYRNVSGKVQKAKLGEYQGGNPPYGFDVVCFGSDGNEKWRSVYFGHFKRKKVYPDGRREQFDGKDNSPRKDATDTLFVRPTIEKERLKIVKQIFNWYANEAISPHQISERLNELRVDPVFGDAWNKVKVRQLLRNPVYIGFPTWNKSAGSRFAEYLGGQIQSVARTNGLVKQGRRRAASDYVQPDKPLFEPIVDQETWDKVQAKAEIASSEQLAVPKRPAQTGELWLKPFLVCGRCGKSMRATRGESTRGMFPSYFCGTYGTYGRKNLTGCHCHRVKHSLLEQIVVDYVRQTSPKVVQLLNATHTGDLEAAKPLIQAISDTTGEYLGLQCDMLLFVDLNMDDRERAKSLKKGMGIRDIYGLAYEQLRPRIEDEIAVKERELDRMLDGYADLTGGIRERAKAKMEDLQREVDLLRRDLVDWRQPYEEIERELAARKSALDRATEVLSNGAAGRQKTEALSAVVDQVVCHFRHTPGKGKYHGKSHLDKVEIVPVSGDSVCFTDGITPAPS
jgi:DNA invertase Pin-like site-specific DNA recombinase